MTNWKELRNLPKYDSTLVAKASDRWYLPDPTKVGDLEKLREKALLKEFEQYKEASKKLKIRARWLQEMLARSSSNTLRSRLKCVR